MASKKTWRALAVLLLAPGSVAAGVRPYAFTYGTDILPDSMIELETWVDFKGPNLKRSRGTRWDFWVGPVMGFNENLEIGFYALVRQEPKSFASDVAPLQLNSLRLQVSYLLAPKGSWPVDVKLLGEIAAPAYRGKSTEGWLTAIVSRDFGKLNLTLNAGWWADFDFDGVPSNFYSENPVIHWQHNMIAASYELPFGVRLGGEFFGEFRFASGGCSRVGTGVCRTSRPYYLGPSVGYAKGQMWVSGALGFATSKDASLRNGRIILGVVL
ncbi:MAG: hypothetical protein ACOZIN_12315 [Myxococcota bacterium]